MEFVEFFAGENDDSRRFDRVLYKMSANSIGNINWNFIAKNIKSGFFRLNDKKAEINTIVHANDSIKIEKHLWQNYFSEKNACQICSAPFNLDKITIFKNDNLLIVNKPYDVLSQGSGSEISLDKIVQRNYQNRSSSLSFKPGAVNRLDRKTTGILCFSQSIKGAKWFSEHSKNHEFKKEYFALVNGYMKKTETWRDFVSKDTNPNEKSIFHTSKIVESGGKLAVTYATPIAFSSDAKNPVTLVKFEIPTGRNHQIRLQSAFHGFPLVNDTSYGAKPNAAHLKQNLYLHCFHVQFPKNDLGVPEKVFCAPNDDFMVALNELQIETAQISQVTKLVQ